MYIPDRLYVINQATLFSSILVLIYQLWRLTYRTITWKILNKTTDFPWVIPHGKSI